MSNTEVVVHINEKLTKEKRDDLSRNICKLKGVESAELSSQRAHLMIVGYNPKMTKSMDVIDGVRGSGVNAQLVGWL